MDQIGHLHTVQFGVPTWYTWVQPVWYTHTCGTIGLIQVQCAHTDAYANTHTHTHAHTYL